MFDFEFINSWYGIDAEFYDKFECFYIEHDYYNVFRFIFCGFGFEINIFTHD